MSPPPNHTGNPDAAEVLGQALALVGEDTQELKAVITPTPDLAFADLERVLAARERNTPLPLDGMTIVVKDNIDIGGVRSTAGSQWFQDRVAMQDATVVRRLRSAGALILGTANLHEFAYGSNSNNPWFGRVRNPWDFSRSPGGSSGGSAAAVAAGWVTGALGTDTGGSVRSPAAYCGLSGLRPTYGVVSNRGVFPLAPSFDTVGPIARRAADVGALFAAMRGSDPLETDEHPYFGLPRLATDALAKSGLRLGISSQWSVENVDPDVTDAVAAALQTLQSLGMSTREVAMPDIGRASEVAQLILNAEALAIHHERLLQDPSRFGEDIQRNLNRAAELAGWEVAAIYGEARELRSALLESFAGVDVLITPTAPTPAVPVDTAAPQSTVPRIAPFMYFWSIAGVPALTVPCGLSSEGLPIGLQLIGPPHSDLLLCALGDAYQRETDWHLRTAPRFAGTQSP
jgi:aspartyl-tRNA(Asn)/glutamyl-tRNA(Gln) amidotransferase subunit A